MSANLFTRRVARHDTDIHKSFSTYEKHVDGHKKEPREVEAPGVLQVVALVGSCDPGGFGVSGDGGAAGIGPTAIRLIANFTLRK
jgi:hypothetical protein